jgi:hypothetical protein
MKTFLHVLKAIGMVSKQKFCKHNNINESSCPFTGMTYKTCESCWKRTSVVKTEL